MNLKETYNRIAEDWHKNHQEDTWWIEGTDAFISLLKPGSSVLDAGCGSGVKARYLAGRGLDVTGVDFSERMIELAKRELPEAKFLVLDLRDLDTLHQTFDGVFVQAALLHVPKKDVWDVLRKLKDKLKVGGYLYLAVKEVKPDQPEEEIRTKDDYGYRYDVFYSYFTLSELKHYLTDLGMSIRYEKVSLSGETNWIQAIAANA